MHQRQKQSIQLKAVSELPGRIRWQVSTLRAGGTITNAVERILARKPGIQRAQVSPVTGRILVYFDLAIPVPAIRDYVEDSVRTALLEAPQARPRAGARPRRVAAGPAGLANAVILGGAAVAVGVVTGSAVGLPILAGGVAAALATPWLLRMFRRHKARLLATTDGREHTDTHELVRISLPYRWRFAISACLAALSAAAAVARLVVIGMAVNAIIYGQPLWLPWLSLTAVESMVVLGGVAIVLSGAYVWLAFLSQELWCNSGRNIQHRLRVHLYGHVQQLGMGYFQDQARGELLSILSDDVNQIERAFDASWHLLEVLLNSVIVCVALFLLIPEVAWVAVLPIPFMLWQSRIYQPRMREHYASVRSRAAALSGRISGNLDGIATIKSFAAEEQELQRIEAGSEGYRAQSQGAITITAGLPRLLEATILVGSVVTALVGGALTSMGPVTVGAYASLVMLTAKLLFPISALGQTLDNVERGLASFGRARRLLSVPAESDRGHRPLDRRAVRGEIVFAGLSFSYTRDAQVFRDLSLRFAAGKTTALVGSSGSGKSTLIKLLLRLYRADAGMILLDGVDTSALRREDLRRAIAVVSQDVFLFRSTVLENIRLGSPRASLNEVIEAARLASAHEFISQLQGGYNAVIGERGQTISGGQMQRIALARAILKDAPILILDEATASLDATTESGVHHALRERFQGRTIIIIAHRLSTIQNADHIYVLEHGTILEEGSHQELLSMNGQYQRFWRAQSGKF